MNVAVKRIEPYRPFKSYGGAKNVYLAWKARFFPNAIAHRRELGILLNAQGLTGVGAEIGVKEGKFSERILHYWKGRRLYSIDPWREFGQDYQDLANVAQTRHDEYYEETQARLARFGTRSTILRLTSEEAAGEIGDGSLDFAYLDAQHHFAAVKLDLALWWPKVRSGGLLGGHDYFDGNEVDEQGTTSVFEVKRAVDEFVRESGVVCFATTKDKRASWFIRKP